ncbi:MAG TPA: TraR/DksA C4-type zinc finger protein [Thermodesulfobacteriota bacterium]|nr:TraR/DksA C4-type zinc finger protein [Thermodesulfobacteriota bacterium]
MIMGTRFCQRCDVEIPAARLEALPDTMLCVQCSEEVGGDFEVTVIPENIGKSGSLKKNYGSWTVKKRRRRIKPKDK